jgi:hypothetical protein
MNGIHSAEARWRPCERTVLARGGGANGRDHPPPISNRQVRGGGQAAAVAEEGFGYRDGHAGVGGPRRVGGCIGF